MLGVDPDKAREASEDSEPEEPDTEFYELPPELWPAWECFVSTWNQWRVIAGLIGVHYDGIDHTALASTMVSGATFSPTFASSNPKPSRCETGGTETHTRPTT